jgi:hypothetical protein
MCIQRQDRFGLFCRFHFPSTWQEEARRKTRLWEILTGHLCKRFLISAKGTTTPKERDWSSLFFVSYANYGTLVMRMQVTHSTAAHGCWLWESP